MGGGSLLQRGEIAADGVLRYAPGFLSLVQGSPLPWSGPRPGVDSTVSLWPSRAAWVQIPLPAPNTPVKVSESSGFWLEVAAQRFVKTGTSTWGEW